MANEQHLPMRGVGPIYVIVCLILTTVGILLERRQILATGDISSIKWPLIVIGCLMILGGIAMWLLAVLQAKIDRHILSNQLVTTGIYAWVHHSLCGI